MYEIKDEQNSNLVPHEFVNKEETSRLIMEIINKLSEEKRLVILMYYYQEMSTTEIAETLEMPLTTVKYKLLVARREIKEELEKLDRNGTRLYAALPLTVLPSVFSKAAQGVNVPAFSAISQSVLRASVGATAGMAGIATAKTRGISTIFKTTTAKVIAAVVCFGVTAAVIISKKIAIIHKQCMRKITKINQTITALKTAETIHPIFQGKARCPKYPKPLLRILNIPLKMVM